MTRTQEAAERTVLPNGLAVHGAGVGDVRLYQFIRDYFESGIPMRPGMTVIDAGANVGLFSLEVLQRCGGDVRLLAFEPAPEAFAHLERNVAEHFPDAGVHCFREALGRRPGDATFYFRPRAPVLSSLEPESAATDWGDHADALLADEPPPAFQDVLPPRVRRLPRFVVRPLIVASLRWMDRKTVELPCTVTTVSRVIDEQGLDAVDFLKVDVEGAELDVLEGIEERHWPRIGAIVAEVHDVDGRLARIHGLLAAHGFADVRTEQDWINAGTDVFTVHALRGASSA